MDHDISEVMVPFNHCNRQPLQWPFAVTLPNYSLNSPFTAILRNLISQGPTRLAVHVGPVGIPLRAKSLSDYQWKQFFFLPQLISKGMTKDVKKNNGELEQKVVKESEDKKGDGEMTIDKQVRRIYWIGQVTRGF